MRTTTPTIHDGTRDRLHAGFKRGDITAAQLSDALERVTQDEAIEAAWEANRDNCPEWCSHHELNGMHSRCVTVGDMWVAVEEIDKPTHNDTVGPYVVLGDHADPFEDAIQGDRLRDFIAALVEARRIIEDGQQ